MRSFNISGVKKIFITIAVQVVVAGLFLGWIYYLKQTSPNRDDAKLEEIKAEVAKIPTPPSFQKLGETDTSRYRDAAVYVYYRSDSNEAFVRSFHSKELAKLGWQIDGSADPPFFQKNDIRLYLEYRPDQDGWNYAWSVVWKNPEN